VALLLFALTERLRKSEIHWQLTEDENLDIQLTWTKNVIKKSDLLEKLFLDRIKS
jgi:hypothetical protein